MKIALSITTFLFIAAGSVAAYIALSGDAFSSTASSTSSTLSSSATSAHTTDGNDTHPTLTPNVAATGQRISNFRVSVNGLLQTSTFGPSFSSDNRFESGGTLYYFAPSGTQQVTLRADDSQDATLRVQLGDETLCTRNVSGSFSVTCSISHKPLYTLSDIAGSSVTFSEKLAGGAWLDMLSPHISRDAFSRLRGQLDAGLTESQMEDVTVPDTSRVNKVATVVAIEDSPDSPDDRGVHLPDNMKAKLFFRTSDETPHRLAPITEGSDTYALAGFQRGDQLFFLDKLDQDDLRLAL